MFKILSAALLLICLSLKVSAQTTLFAIYDKEGHASTFENLINQSLETDVVLFGELHNNAVVHWLQLQLLKSLSIQHPQVLLSGEFFEKDDQLNIDEWLQGRMTDKQFETEAKLWNNYLTDYKPLLLFAKSNKIPFVASNVPRKYAAMVSKNGLGYLQGLSKQAKKHIAPLPIKVDPTLPGYAAMKDMMHGSSMNIDFMIEAQALKDATMAHSMVTHYSKESLILHINGSYHSNNSEGIGWYLRQHKPKIRIVTINTVEQDSTEKVEPENLNTADFIIVLPKDSPKSY
jgi:uncharacterized iron-regulated protein